MISTVFSSTRDGLVLVSVRSFPSIDAMATEAVEFLKREHNTPRDVSYRSFCVLEDGEAPTVENVARGIQDIEDTYLGEQS